MSNIEEDAFQIARYLLENPDEIEQLEIQKAFDLSDADFRLALKYLVDAGYCHTAGQFGKGIIRDKNIASLQGFVEQVGIGRVSLSLGAERLLKFLFLSQSHVPFSLCNPVMKKFGWKENQYLQITQELGDKGLVRGEKANDNPFFRISITSPGREIVRNNFRLPNSSQNSLQIFGNNNIVNFSSTLNSVNQLVQANSIVESPSKQELERLLRELEVALRDVPKGNEDDVEAVANMAKSLIESATREKPNKPLVQVSADGLRRAAENIATITPKVLLTAQAIIVFIRALFPELLP